jgi:hypothetical protein
MGVCSSHSYILRGNKIAVATEDENDLYKSPKEGDLSGSLKLTSKFYITIFI